MINTNINKNFLAWLVGFIDAEGCFFINRKTMSNGNIRYAFGLKIKLHIDELALLNTIQSTLGIGWLEKPRNNTCCFQINSESELRSLIGLLDNIPLMGIKDLDFLSFKEAFFLYFNRPGSVTETIQARIEEIRAQHNTKRTEFKPTLRDEGFKSSITDYKFDPQGENNPRRGWFLGFIEGEGSFFVRKADLTPRFELELTSAQKALLESIKAYLESKFANVGNIKGGIKVRNTKAKFNNSKGGVRLEITGIEYLHKYFNPYLKNLKFFSNKEIDFKDFCFICESLYKKAHINQPEVKELLLNRAAGMNKARLSTYKKPKSS